MNFLEKYIDKLFIKQWNVGIAKKSTKSILEINLEELDFKWFKLDNNSQLFADPFVHQHNNHYYVFFENYKYHDDYGKISLKILNDDLTVIYESDLLDTKSHLSYPYIFNDNGKIFILPESSKEKEGNQYFYEFDFETNSLKNGQTLLSGERLLDATILHHDNKYWIFATKRGHKSESELFLFHSKSWYNGYLPHSSNPIKDCPKNSRPAGNFIIEDGLIIRPTQNCEKYYGKSILLNQIKTLNNDLYEEIPVKEIVAPLNSKYNFAIHTINISNDVIVIDGLRRIFNPFEQIKNLITRKLFRN